MNKNYAAVYKVKFVKRKNCQITGESLGLNPRLITPPVVSDMRSYGVFVIKRRFILLTRTHFATDTNPENNRIRYFLEARFYELRIRRFITHATDVCRSLTDKRILFELKTRFSRWRWSTTLTIPTFDRRRNAKQDCLSSRVSTGFNTIHPDYTEGTLY